MAQGTYQVIFSGKIIEHADLDMVKTNVARVFSLDTDKVEKLFSGKRLVLKKDIDQSTAERYKVTLQRAGALCEIEDSAAEQAQQPITVSPEAVPQETATPVEPDEAVGPSIAPVGITLIESDPVPDANIDTGTMDMAEVGITLAESDPVPDANIDTSGMDMDEVGVQLVEPESVPDVDIDTSALDMDEAGTTLIESQEFVEAEFDLAGMTMDAPGEQLVEHEAVPDADIDTSKISLS